MTVMHFDFERTTGIGIIQTFEPVEIIKEPVEIIKEPIEITELVIESFNNVLQRNNVSLDLLSPIENLVIVTVQDLDCWVAGGAPLALYSGDTKNIKDWDLFFEDVESLILAKNKYKSLGFEETKTSEWSHSLKQSNVIVQLINRKFYKNVGEIFGNFDLSVCCFAIEGDQFIYSKQAEEDFKSKEFNFIYTECLPSLINRVAIYGAKGFRPSRQFTRDIGKIFKKVDLEELGPGSES